MRYAGRTLDDAHRHLGVTEAAWSAVVAHLVDTLVSLGVDESTIGEIATALTPLYDQIVTTEQV